MRHHPEDVAGGVRNPPDVVERAIGVGLRRDRAVFRAVAEDDLVLGFQSRERRLVSIVVAFAVGYREGQYLTWFAAAGEGRHCVLDANMNVLTDKGKGTVAQHGARQQSRFQQDLKAIADTEDESSGFGKADDRRHHGREPGDRAGAEIVPVGEAAGNDDRIYLRQRGCLVPDEVSLDAQDLRHGLMTVAIAIGPREDEDTDAQWSSHSTSSI